MEIRVVEKTKLLIAGYSLLLSLRACTWLDGILSLAKIKRNDFQRRIVSTLVSLFSLQERGIISILFAAIVRSNSRIIRTTTFTLISISYQL